MDDILSGGRIDSSASGPVPSNKDDRSGDILLEQREKQDQDSVGGTQFPPKPQPLPPIPEAIEVAPPLPIVPSFDFNISGSALEETREIARQTVVDVLKNVTINGQGPSIEGSTISFNIPQQPPASEAFIFQGIMVPQPLPQTQAPQTFVTPQLQKTELPQEIQSLVVAPPERKQPPQEIVQESITEIGIIPQPQIARPTELEEFENINIPKPEIKISEQIKLAAEITFQPEIIQSTSGILEAPTIEGNLVIPEAPTFLGEQEQPIHLLETDLITNPIESEITIKTPSAQKDRIEKPQETSIEETKQPEKPSQEETIKDGDGGGFKPKYDKLSSYPVFEDILPEYQNQEVQTNNVKNGTKISFDEAQEIRDVSRKEGTEISFEKAQEIRDESRGEDSSKNAYARAEARRQERRKQEQEEDPSFDKDSEERQKGETKKEFIERQEKLKQEKEETVKKEEFLKRARDGDISECPSGMVPVALTRADGQKKILAYLSSEFVGVTEGGEGDERITELPPEDSYYEGGGGSGRHPFQISTSTNEAGNITLTVNVGTLNSLLPSNVFNGPALREFSVGSGLRYVVLTGTSDGKKFTSCSLSVAIQAVQPQTPTVFGLPTTAAFLLGVVYNGSVFQVQKTNLLVAGKQQYVKEKATPAEAGTLPYEIYYVWG